MADDTTMVLAAGGASLAWLLSPLFVDLLIFGREAELEADTIM
jgi:hypothetical protein